MARMAARKSRKGQTSTTLLEAAKRCFAKTATLVYRPAAWRRRPASP